VADQQGNDRLACLLQLTWVLARDRPSILFGYVTFCKGFPTSTKKLGVTADGFPDADLKNSLPGLV